MSSLARWKRYTYDLIAAEVSSITHYFDRVIQVAPLAGDTQELLARIECQQKETASEDSLPDLTSERDRRTAAFLNGNLNHDLHIQGTLRRIGSRLSRNGRVIVVAYNAYYGWLYRIAVRLGLKEGATPSTFVTYADVGNLARLSGLELVRARPAVYCPWRFFGIGHLINAVMPLIPLLRSTALVSILVFRPTKVFTSHNPSISVIVPARNERDNIEAAVLRLPDFGAPCELIFVEGHSTDGTWEEIQRVIRRHSSRLPIRGFQQSGVGKSDAVRMGFAQARNEILTILDADLTMPPENLIEFYEAYRDGLADFINGSRLVYPMEGGAMHFLNRLGNVFFAKSLSYVLETALGDSLCGTKLVAAHDYARFTTWRNDFGDFDPFGDFELLFPAASLGLGIIDIPVRYRARTYGETNIRRFRHGVMLFKMTMIGLLRLKSGRIPRRAERPAEGVASATVSPSKRDLEG